MYKFLISRFFRLLYIYQEIKRGMACIKNEDKYEPSAGVPRAVIKLNPITYTGFER